MGMVGERRQHGIEPGNAIVIEQQPHPHAAVRSGSQFIEQKQPGGVTMPDVILHIETGLRLPYHQHPCRKGLQGIIERVNAGQPRAGHRLRRQHTQRRRIVGNPHCRQAIAPARQPMQQHEQPQPGERRHHRGSTNRAQTGR